MTVVETNPSPAEFAALARDRAVIPVVRRLPLAGADPAALYAALAAQRPDTFLLETAPSRLDAGRWSFIGVRCPAALAARSGRAHWRGAAPPHMPAGGDRAEREFADEARDTLAPLRPPERGGLPPFAGGFAGYLGYDTAVRRFGLVPANRDELAVPESLLLWAADLAAVDHDRDELLLIANAETVGDGAARAYADALDRVDAMRRSLAEAGAAPTVDGPGFARPLPDGGRRPEPSDADFERVVRAAVERVRAGEADQIVVSERFAEPFEADAWDAYLAMRALVPSAYMFFFRFGAESAAGTPFELAGCSPEPVATVRGGRVRVRPVAGTRARGATPEQDRLAERELRADPKERAEHLMLVDLARRDLAAVCRAGSVHDEELLEVVRYGTLMHLRSSVAGELEHDRSAVEALLACMPAGTVCGTPRESAAKVIEELEGIARGWYGGAVGYLGHTGDAEAAIAIRSTLLRQSVAYVQAGAGVVADSVPRREVVEARNKAGGVLGALRAAADAAGR